MRHPSTVTSNGYLVHDNAVFRWKLIHAACLPFHSSFHLCTDPSLALRDVVLKNRVRVVTKTRNFITFQLLLRVTEFKTLPLSCNSYFFCQNVVSAC
jgi:hypothetical protein